jgi:hypothetical protein
LRHWAFAMRDLSMGKWKRTFEHRSFSAADHSTRTCCIMFASRRLIKRPVNDPSRSRGKDSIHAGYRVRRNKVDLGQERQLEIGVR